MYNSIHLFLCVLIFVCFTLLECKLLGEGAMRLVHGTSVCSNYSLKEWINKRTVLGRVWEMGTFICGWWVCKLYIIIAFKRVTWQHQLKFADFHTPLLSFSVSRCPSYKIWHIHRKTSTMIFNAVFFTIVKNPK